MKIEQTELPPGWEWSTMEEIANVVGGGTPKTNDPTNYERGTIPWITPADLSGYTAKHIAHGARFITQKGLNDSSAKMMPAGTVLFTSRAPIGYVAIASNPVCTNQGFKSFVLKEGVLPDYVYWWLKGSKDLAESMASGTTFLELSGAKAKQLPIPVAPLDQQKHIVAEIEKQFSRLDEAVANLKRVKANLKRYKAAVLKAAVEGRLVETEAELARREGRSLPTPRPGIFYVYAIRCNDDSIYIGHTDDLARRWEEHLAGQGADWTKQHKPMQIVHYEKYSSRQEAADREKWLKTGYGRKWIKREIEAGRARQVGYETGTQLLQRILETRRQQWLARAEKAGGKGKGKYKEPATPDTTDLPELPEGWVWTTYAQIGEVTTGFTPPTADAENFGGDIPFFKPTDLDAGDNVVMAREFLSEKGAAKGRLLPAGSVLVTCIGATIGKTGLARVGCATNQQINAVSPVQDLAESAFVYSWTVSPSGHKQILDNASATTLPILNKSKFEALPIPLPPLAEQKRIVAELDRRLSLACETEAQVDANLKRAERLHQSTLKTAFIGLLVPQVR
ncbi:MAG: restriction endonuclease subunit S [Pseudomonadota bacterium]